MGLLVLVAMGHASFTKLMREAHHKEDFPKILLPYFQRQDFARHENVGLLRFVTYMLYVTNCLCTDLPIDFQLIITEKQMQKTKIH